MADYVNKIRSLDVSLFAPIPSQTSSDDRKSMLVLQNCIRESGPYVYLEIGSHLGGSISPHFVDPLCRLIYSIDKRPLVQPDERGRDYEYMDNSSLKMLQNLETAFPSVNLNKIKAFDCDVSKVERTEVIEKPKLCFIDGEHTNIAVINDCMFCLEVCDTNSIIAFHDTKTVCNGIEKIKAILSERSIRYRGMMLGGCVYAILLNGAIDAYYEKLKPICQKELIYLSMAKVTLFIKRFFNKINLPMV
jgi:hypothetical protein